MRQIKTLMFTGLLIVSIVAVNQVFGQGALIEFDPGVSIQINSPVNHSELIDVNGDGNRDIIALVGEPGVDSAFLVLLGAANGTFAAPITNPMNVSFPWSAAMGDFNEDGLLDAIVTDLIGGQFSYLRGNGDGTFALEPRLIPGWSGGNPKVLAIDVDEDDHLDLVAPDFFGSRLLVAWGTGIDDPFDAFDAVTAVEVSGFPLSMDVADLDADGDLDLCCGFNSGSGGGVAISLATGTRTFAPPQRLIAGLVGSHWSVKAVDLDGGSPEIVTVSEADGFVGIYPQVAGVLQDPVLLPVVNSSRHCDTGDLDLDGVLDLVVRDANTGNFQVFQGLGGFNFQLAANVVGPVSFSAVQLIDVDEDGLLDIFCSDYNDQTASIYRNASQVGVPFIRADVNTDGSTNVADAIFLLAFLFSGGVGSSCMDASDTNDDGSINISDAITLLAVLFSGGGPTPDPIVNCGLDPTEDTLDCESTGASCL